MTESFSVSSVESEASGRGFSSRWAQEGVGILAEKDKNRVHRLSFLVGAWHAEELRLSQVKNLRH